MSADLASTDSPTSEATGILWRTAVGVALAVLAFVALLAAMPTLAEWVVRW